MLDVQGVVGSNPSSRTSLLIRHFFQTGDIAQLGAHLAGSQGVRGSSPLISTTIHAGMAELADALDSGSSELMLVQVQVLFPAP